MQGAPSLFLAEIAIPSAKQCLTFAAPFLSVAAFWWLVRRMDYIIDYLFPHWEWERKLGWLDIRTERRSGQILRWIGYVVYAALAVALYGIVWAAPALSTLDRLSDPAVARDLLRHVPVLLVSLGFWLVYLGLSLIPRLRHEYEKDELDRFRAEQKEIEEERERNPASRMKSPSPQTRFGRPTRSNRMGPGS